MSLQVYRGDKGRKSLTNFSLTPKSAFSSLHELSPRDAEFHKLSVSTLGVDMKPWTTSDSSPEGSRIHPQEVLSEF